MRIVIDLQCVQAKGFFVGIGRYSLLLAKAIARNREGYEVIIVLNGLFLNTIELIRAEFDGLIAQENIKVWHSVSFDHAWNENEGKYFEVVAHVREAFLSSLKPDWVIVPGFTGEAGDEAFERINLLPRHLRVVVVMQLTLDESDQIACSSRQLEQIKHAEYVFVLPPLSTAEVSQKLEMPIARMHGLSCSVFGHVNAQDVNADSENILSFLQGAHCLDPVEIRKESRPRLAYVSPLPPEKTGIADYSAELLPELANYYDVDVVVGQVQISDPWIVKNCKVCQVEWFVENAHCYERVIYHFGNSHYHAHMFELIERVPGIVVLHDFFLGDIQRYREVYGFAKHAWSNSLYDSHGYKALRARICETDEFMVRAYPANLDVLKYAVGVVVHSEFSRKLASEWYGQGIAADWSVLPLLRASPVSLDRAACREYLGLREDDFVVCSFGLLGPNKLNHRLLAAWLNSGLATDQRCILVFVGESPVGEYGSHLEQEIKSSGLKGKVRITGWVDMSTYRHYLAAADVGVQLRANSRGETSAAVLDCMSYGLPTIANANGAMAELPSEGVYLLPDTFEDRHLIEALEFLWKEVESREQLAKNSLALIKRQHSPSSYAAALYANIEGWYRKLPPTSSSLVSSIAKLDGVEFLKGQLVDVARAIDAALPMQRSEKTIFIDITATCRTDLRTGIERVARALTIALIENQPAGYRVEPVYLEKRGCAWVYSYARHYTASLLGISQDGLQDEVAQPACGDVVLGLDISGDLLTSASDERFFEYLRANGVLVYFMVHDLLPLLLPHTFPPGADIAHARWLSAIAQMDGAVCVTKAVADDLNAWCLRNMKRKGRPFHITVSHHGADVNNSAPTKGLPASAYTVLSECKIRPTFLMVGTIEPRKGYLLALDAFTKLWAEGVDINLVIVGKEGWVGLPDEMRRVIPKTIKYLRSHSEQGKRLFWLEGVSDEYLEKVYAASTCLVAASEGEGFGLPLIESAQHGLPIIARDIPVFREVAGESAYYFSGNSALELADGIRAWLALYREGMAPSSENIPWITWRESALNIFSLVADPNSSKGKDVYRLEGKADRLKVFIDVSVIYREDFGTGIQRVVRAILTALLGSEGAFDVVPVYLDLEGEAWNYKVANIVLQNEKLIFERNKSSCSVEFSQKDILLCLDLAGGYVVGAWQQGLFCKIKQKGTKIYFVVYDLLPVQFSNYFSVDDVRCYLEWLKVTAESNGVICISRAVSEDYRKWLCEGQPKNRDFKISSFHLGADLKNSSPSFGLPDNWRAKEALISCRPSFLLVGTIEPRKGYEQVLSAFEILWGKNFDLGLVIVGKQGWMMPDFCKRLSAHPEFGRRLFWLEGISDEYLEKVYAASTCLIAASEGEGFGLPLIEAAQHRLPIIARDIPVFREVAGEHAYYFKGLSAGELALAVTDWLQLYRVSCHPISGGMPWLTWKESKDQLLAALFERH